MSNILSAIIKVEAPGVDQTTNKVAQSVNKVEQSLKKVTPVSNQASTAILNFGRVIQDAPYAVLQGNISAIANNIDPLVESLRRAGQAAGGFKGAMKSIGQSLLGGAGIGLAISAVTSALVLFGDKLFGTTKKVEEHKDAVQAGEGAYAQYLKRLQEVENALSAEGLKFNFLSDALKDSNTGISERTAIIEQLQNSYPEYLSNLDKEKRTYDGITSSIQSSVEALAKAAEIKALLPEAEKILSTLIGAQVELNQLRRGGFAGDDEIALLLPSKKEFDEEEKRLTNIIKRSTGELTRAKAFLTNLAGSGESLIDILYGNLAKNKEAAKKIQEVAQGVPDEVKVNLRGIEFFLPPKEREDALQKIRDAIKAISEGAGRNTGLEGIKIPISGIFKQIADKNAAKALEDLTKKLNTARFAANALGDAFGAAFDAILDGQNVIKAMGEALKRLVVDLIKATLQTLIFKAIANFLAPGLGSAVPGGASGVSVPGMGGVAGRSGNLGGFAGGITVNVQGELVGRGGSLVAVVNQTNLRQGRLGG